MYSEGLVSYSMSFLSIQRGVPRTFLPNRAAYVGLLAVQYLESLGISFQHPDCSHGPQGFALSVVSISSGPQSADMTAQLSYCGFLFDYLLSGSRALSFIWGGGLGARETAGLDRAPRGARDYADLGSG